MPEQPAVSGLRDAMKKPRDAMKKKVTRREQFLAGMDAVAPRARLTGPEAGPVSGRPPAGRGTISRIRLLRGRHAPGGPTMEASRGCEARHSPAGPGDARIPGGTTILNVRRLPERHGPAGAILADGNAHLSGRGISPRPGDARISGGTVIDALALAGNRAGARDPGMSSSGKGNDRFSGMGAHSGVNVDGGVTRSPGTTTARIHDSPVPGALLHGDRTPVRADRGCASAGHGVAPRRAGGIRGVMRRASEGGEPCPPDARASRIIAMVRAKAGRLCRVIRSRPGHVRTRRRGLAGSRARPFILAPFAPGRLFLVRRALPA